MYGFEPADEFYDVVSTHNQRLHALANDKALSNSQRTLIKLRAELLKKRFEQMDDVYNGPVNADYKRFAIKYWPPFSVGRESVNFMDFLSKFGELVEYKCLKRYVYKASNIGYTTVTFNDPDDEVYDKLFISFQPFLDIDKFDSNGYARKVQQQSMGIEELAHRVFDVERHTIPLEQAGLELSLKLHQWKTPETERKLQDSDMTGKSFDETVRNLKQAGDRLTLNFNGFLK
ncbi:hypothetical protein V1512DRAFT_210664 [Lipomyces arxii]|uniref:uncharacterized protein n=1 Tax=Lipomyces arxii TaxID=56418 RepID=UPI0034CF9215